MSVRNLAQFIRDHKNYITIHVHVGTDSAPVRGAFVFDNPIENQVYVTLSGETIVLDVDGPTNPRLNTILFKGYSASVFLYP